MLYLGQKQESESRTVTTLENEYCCSLKTTRKNSNYDVQNMKFYIYQSDTDQLPALSCSLNRVRLHWHKSCHFHLHPCDLPLVFPRRRSQRGRSGGLVGGRHSVYQPARIAGSLRIDQLRAQHARVSSVGLFNRKQFPVRKCV